MFYLFLSYLLVDSSDKIKMKANNGLRKYSVALLFMGSQKFCQYNSVTWGSSSRTTTHVRQFMTTTSVRSCSIIRSLFGQRSVIANSRIMSAPKGDTQTAQLSVDLGDMRIKYKDKSETFTEDRLDSKEPIGQFKAWFDVACKTPGIHEANAMVLATATKDGMPSSRPVLLKGFGSEGFKFYTNYESRKGRELAENPNASLTFFWEPLRRTVRVEGTVEKTSAEDSDIYFTSRPFASQIGAHASKQSAVIAGRNTLMIRERELLAQFPDGKVPRPPCWGGFIVKPRTVEFWQGQSDRLHDRIRFRRPQPGEKIDNVLVHQGDDGWVFERLSP